MKLYFGNWVTTVTMVMVVTYVGFIIYSLINRNQIEFWGRRSLFLFAYGLLICCFAATRDGLDQTIQYAIDGSGAAGIFPLISIPNLVGCIGAAIILIAGIITIFSKSQHMKEILFFTMASGVMLKIITMEIARIVVNVKG